VTYNKSQVIGYRKICANTIFLFVYGLNRKIRNSIPKENEDHQKRIGSNRNPMRILKAEQERREE